MSSFQKAFLSSKLPPSMGLPPKSLSSSNAKSTGRKHQKLKQDFTPVQWSKYFKSRVVVSVGENKFCTYTYGESGPLLVLLHGGGFSALTWALFAIDIVDSVECQVLAIDIRGHGDTKTTDDADLSAETLANDVGDIVQARYPDNPPPIILVGHSMGGAIAIHAAFKHVVPSSIGLIVIDVVEGTAMDALVNMQTFLRNRPSSFKSIEDAISWSVWNNQVRNLESAKVSVPGQIKNIETGLLSTNEIANHDATEVEISLPSKSFAPETILEDEVDFKVPEPSKKGTYTWRIDLCATEKYWVGWFEGLSKAFLSCSQQKLLLLANVDRLDRDLIVGQMQGKFEMHVLPKCGHAVHEDAPDKVANVVANFLVRNKFAEPKANFTKLMPGC